MAKTMKWCIIIKVLFDGKTSKYIAVYKIFILDRNTCYYVTVCKNLSRKKERKKDVNENRKKERKKEKRKKERKMQI